MLARMRWSPGPRIAPRIVLRMVFIGSCMGVLLSKVSRARCLKFALFYNAAVSSDLRCEHCARLEDRVEPAISINGQGEGGEGGDAENQHPQRAQIAVEPATMLVHVAPFSPDAGATRQRTLSPHLSREQGLRFKSGG